MKYITKLKLAAVHQLCDVEDKSTEYMLQLMQDVCNIDLDCCIKYLEIDEGQQGRLFRELNELTEVMIKLGE